MSPAMTLKSVVLPAPFGPRMPRRSPGVTARSTSLTAWSPPKRRPTPRRRRIGRASFASGCASLKPLLDQLARDDAVLDDLDLALPGRLRLLARRLRAAGRRALLREEAAERLRHVRDVPDDGRRQLAVRALLSLQRPLVLDRLAVALELDDAAARALVAGLDRPRQARLDLPAELALRLRQALNQRPRRVVVVVDEPVGVVAAVQPREHLRHARLVLLRGGRLQPGRGAEAADVRSAQSRCHLGEVAEEREEEVADELLRLRLSVRLLVGLERGAGAGAADHPEVAVDRARRRQLPDVRRVVGRVQRWEDPLHDLAAHRAEVRDQTGGGRPAEAVVVHDDRG